MHPYTRKQKFRTLYQFPDIAMIKTKTRIGGLRPDAKNDTATKIRIGAIENLPFEGIIAEVAGWPNIAGQAS